MKRSTITFLTLLTLLFSVNVWAKTDFVPRISLEEEYNDNLFLNHTNQSEDYITTLEPGFELDLDRRDLKLELDYSLRFRIYQENTQNNQTEFREVQRGLANLSLWPGKRFTVIGLGEMSLVAVDEREGGGASSDLTNRALRYKSVVNPQLHLPIGKTFSFDMGYTYERINYERLSGSVGSEGDNTQQHRYDAAAIYKPIKGTAVSLGYILADQRVETKEDYLQQTAFFGLKQDIGKRLLLDARFGPTRVDFESSGSIDDQAWDFELIYTLSSQTSMNLKYKQDFTTSVSSGTYKSKDLNAELEYTGKFNFKLGTFWRDSAYVKTLQQDRSYGSDLSLLIPLYRRFNLLFSGRYTRYDFQPIDEQADRYEFGPSLKYEFKKADFDLTYTLNQNDSSFSYNDYTNNIVSLRIELRY